jgi:hypothetical protein
MLPSLPSAPAGPIVPSQDANIKPASVIIVKNMIAIFILIMLSLT